MRRQSPAPRIHDVRDPSADRQSTGYDLAQMSLTSNSKRSWPTAAVCQALFWLLTTSAVYAEPIDLHVDRMGSRLQVSAAIAVRSPAALCYDVIADFNRLADFIPALRSSRIVSEPGEPLLLRQVGQTTLGLSIYAIDVTLALEADPPRRIKFTRVAGNLSVMDGRWLVSGDEASCVIDYRADLEPRFWVPPLLGPLLMRRQIQTQLEALEVEIIRRIGSMGGQPKNPA